MFTLQAGHMFKLQASHMFRLQAGHMFQDASWVHVWPASYGPQQPRQRTETTAHLRPAALDCHSSALLKSSLVSSLLGLAALAALGKPQKICYCGQD